MIAPVEIGRVFEDNSIDEHLPVCGSEDVFFFVLLQTLRKISVIPNIELRRKWLVGLAFFAKMRYN